MFKLLQSDGTGDEQNSMAQPYTYKDEPISADSTIEGCVSFIKKCQEDNQQPHTLRGPYLAALMLYQRLLDEELDPVIHLGMKINSASSFWIRS